jgi:hypothetical protein
MFIQEHDCTTGEITQRELTAKEIKQREADYKIELAKIAEVETKAAQRLIIAERLGLTPDELQLLLG